MPKFKSEVAEFRWDRLKSRRVYRDKLINVVVSASTKSNALDLINKKMSDKYPDTSKLDFVIVSIREV